MTLYEPPEKCSSGNDNATLDGALASFAPPYASIYTRYEDLCSELTDIDLAYSTINLRTGRPITLLDLFSERDLFIALRNDSYVKKVIAGQSPRNLDQLFDAFAQGKQTCINLSRDVLDNFAFYAVGGDKVKIRLGLPYSHSGTLNCTYGFDQLGLSLPASFKLMSILKSAQVTGLLMQNLKLRNHLLKRF